MTTELLAWLIDATLATSFAATVVLLLRKPLQRWLGAEIAYRLWVAVPLAAIAACFALPRPEEAVAAAPAAAIAQAAPSVVVQVATTLRSVDADRWLLAVWLFGACALVGVLAWQQRRFIARLRLRRDRDGSWRSAVPDATPAVLGVLRQKLVLPETFETAYSHAEQELVLAHERMHQRRRDPWALAGCAALRTVFWFNPLLHAAASRFRRDVELACDAAVLRAHPASRRDYADALLKTQMAGDPLPVGCQWHHIPPMKERIMLLKLALPARRARLAGAICVALAMAGSVGIALAAHNASLDTASALAAVAAPAPHAQAYLVDLAMSVDGKPVAHPKVLTHAGETAMVKIDENGVAWGFRFHVDPLAGGRGVALTGDVVAGRDDHVIGHSHHEETAGGPVDIDIRERPGTPQLRIHAQVAATDHAPRASAMDAVDDRAPGPGERREVRIVTGRPAALADSGRVERGSAAPLVRREIRVERGEPAEMSDDERIEPGTPAPHARRTIRVEAGEAAELAPDAELDIDDGMPGEPVIAGGRRDVRETRTCSKPDAQGRTKCKVTREVTVSAPGGDTPEIAPLPPLPPPPPPPHAMAPMAPMQALPPVPPPPPPRMAHGMRPPVPPTPPTPPARMRGQRPPPPPMVAMAPPPPPRMAAMAPPPPPPNVPPPPRPADPSDWAAPPAPPAPPSPPDDAMPPSN